MKIQSHFFRPISLAVALALSGTGAPAVSQILAPPPVADAKTGGQSLGAGADVSLPPLPPVVPPAQKLTLAQVIAYAQTHSPQLLAAGYGVAAARANYVGQRVPANPTVGFSGLNNTVAPTYFGDLSNYVVYLPIETSGKLRWRTRQSKNEWLQSQADAQTTGITVQQSVENAYISLQAANRALTDEQEAYADALKLRELTRKQFEAGGSPETNAIRAQVALTQETANFYSAINSVQQARAGLNNVIGQDAQAPIDAAEPLEYRPVTLELDELRTLAAKNRPELASAEYNRRALSAAASLARAQLYPDVVLGKPLQGTNNIELGFTLPLFDFGGIRGATQQAQKQEKAQEAVLRQIRQNVGLDVQTAYNALNLAAQTAEAYRSGILPQSESLLRRVTQGYQLGASTILDLIDAQATLRTVRIAYYGAIAQHRQALAQLERATGAPLAALRSAPLPPIALPAK